MSQERFVWRYEGHQVALGVNRLGRGPAVLLLPALSSISTQTEMHPLQKCLAHRFTTITVDWPGFGTLPRAFLDWRPAFYRDFVECALSELAPTPYAIIAAGHAAAYVVDHCASHGAASRHLVLLSPTWRGPLPTMLGGDRAIFARLAKAFDPPVVGALLYRLNINRFVVAMMARGHVYEDPGWLTRARLREKLAVSGARGARHASARFVTGRLDPFRHRADMLAALGRVRVPVLNMFSEHAPPKSRLEMEAMAHAVNVTTVRASMGKLSFYEEHASIAADAILDFLAPDAVHTPDPADAG